jgi:DNA-binding HxlR family transcriptional regulator
MALKLRKNRGAPPPCPLSKCMSLLGGTWTAHVLWYLGSGPRRFGELRVDIHAISAKVLSARLRELEMKRLLTRQVKPTSPPSVEYELTELGKELLPALNAIVDVGKKLKDRNVELVAAGAKRRKHRPLEVEASQL